MSHKKEHAKRPPMHTVKATVSQALKKLPLDQRIEVVASVFASMGLPFLAGILREANS